MSELPENHERIPHMSEVERAGKNLMKRLREAGSLENLALSIQDDYLGDDDREATGQLYQLLHIARFTAGAGLPDSDIPDTTIHSLYTGGLIGTAVIDYVMRNRTQHLSTPPGTHNVSSGILSSMYRQLQAERKELSHGNHPNINEQHHEHHNVVQLIMDAARTFSDDPRNSDLKDLIDSLLNETHSTNPNILLVQRGFWILMRQWRTPYGLTWESTKRLLDETDYVSTEHLDSGIYSTKSNVTKSDIMSHTEHELHVSSDLELQLKEFKHREKIEEWPRQDLFFETRDIVTRTNLLHDLVEADFLRKGSPDRLQKPLDYYVESLLNAYVLSKWQFKENDLFYAAGGFIALANRGELRDGIFHPFDQPRSDTHSYQQFTDHDADVVIGKSNRPSINYELRGFYKQMTICTSFSDKDSYSLDISDDVHFAATSSGFEPSVPCILLEGVAVINKLTGQQEEFIDIVEIPLTHSRLQLGRIIPPVPENE